MLDQIQEDETLPAAPEQKEMTFVDHLEELRWHLIRAMSSIFVFAIAAFLAKEIVIGTLILGPSTVEFPTYRFFCWFSEVTCIDKLPFVIQSRTMTGQFTMHLASSLAVGLICAFPYAFWEVWRFVRPGLQGGEKLAARGAVFVVSILFMLGISFGYFLVAPLSINFLSNYQIDPSIVNEFDIMSYVSTLAMIVLACGIMFQLPVVVYFLSAAGIVTPGLMRAFRKHSFIIILAASAIITPPDVVSQVLIAGPLTLLYEAGIFISARVEKQRNKRLANL